MDADRVGEQATTSSSAPVHRLRRAERREQILSAATRAFARAGFTATNLDDIAIEAGITRAILYRHFDSKADLYREVLDRASTRLAQTVGVDEFDENALHALIRAAGEDPDAFRLLFRHAAREPEFSDWTDAFTAAATDVARRNLATVIPAGPWMDWAAIVIPVITVEAIIGWLNIGQPDAERVAERIGRVISGIFQGATLDS